MNSGLILYHPQDNEFVIFTEIQKGMAGNLVILLETEDGVKMSDWNQLANYEKVGEC